MGCVDCLLRVNMSSMKLVRILGLAIVCGVILGVVPASTVAGDLELAAREFVSLLDQGEFQKATETFDATMRGAASPGTLEGIWLTQLQTTGAFQEIEGTRTEPAGIYQMVFVTCRFERQRLDVKVVFDPESRIAGLFLVPSPTQESPEYVDPARFRESEVVVGAKPWELPGTLTLPAGDGPFAAVVLVHGSGPNDRDETVGPNKPFRDLAWGLATRGIAVLRYDKRSLIHGQEMAAMGGSMTVQEETIDDALLAVALLRTLENIRNERIFVVGHSLGGMLVPRIAEGDPEIAGFVVMAGNARPLEDLILEQVLFQMSLRDPVSAEDRKTAEAIADEVEAIRDLTPKSPADEMHLGVPAGYWLDLQGYAPVTSAAVIEQPLLILQGEEDCQVSAERDFGEWQRALSARPSVNCKLYPAVNHLFMTVEGGSTGAEYQLPGHVASVVVEDIADWIGEN